MVAPRPRQAGRGPLVTTGGPGVAQDHDSAGPGAATAAALALPQITLDGRFQLLRVLGAGTAACVYEATDCCAGQQVALKAFAAPPPPAPFAGACSTSMDPAGALTSAAGGVPVESSGAAAAREYGVLCALGAGPDAPAAAAAAAAAAGIPRAYEQGILSLAPAAAATSTAGAAGATSTVAPLQGIPFLSLQLLGPDLFALAEAGAFGAGPEGRRRVVQVGHCVLNALKHMHSRGFVHGDIKPENILAAAPATPAGSRGSGASSDATGTDAGPPAFYLADFGSVARWNASTGSDRGGPSNNSSDREQQQQPPSGGGCPDADNVALPLWCTPAFASAAALHGAPPAPADDAESLCCVLLFLSTGGQLPWDGFIGAAAEHTAGPCAADGVGNRRGGAGGLSEGGGWTARELAAMGDAKERAWRVQIEEGNPHLMPPFIAAAYEYATSLPCGAPLDFARLRALLADSERTSAAALAAWEAKQAARKRRRAADAEAWATVLARATGGASGGGGNNGPARRRAWRPAGVSHPAAGSGGGAAAGTCGGVFGLALSGGAAEE